MVGEAKLPCPSLGQVNVGMSEEQLWFELGSTPRRCSKIKRERERETNVLSLFVPQQMPADLNSQTRLLKRGRIVSNNP